MSNAICEFWTLDMARLLGYGDYAGSSDIVAPKIVAQVEDVWPEGKSYALGGWEEREACEHESVKAWAYLAYGGGFYWPTKVCEVCMVITGQLSPYEPDQGYAPIGFSEERRKQWDQEVEFWRRWREEGWPRDDRLDPKIATKLLD